MENIHEDMTEVIHFRKKSVQATNVKFICGNKHVNVTEDYKYLDLRFNDHVNMPWYKGSAGCLPLELVKGRGKIPKIPVNEQIVKCDNKIILRRKCIC